MGEMIFEVGATVKLRSGGPLMTICAKDEREREDVNAVAWLCAWFSVGLEMCVAPVDERALVREEPPRP